jgi:hypothetical protein
MEEDILADLEVAAEAMGHRNAGCTNVSLRARALK